MTQPTKNLIAQRYRSFGANEASGHSPLYEKLSAHVADSDAILTFLAKLPADRQQPNLFFAAVRLVAGRPVHPDELEDIVISRAASIAAVMQARTTQTNEAGRCAVLLPALARLPQPLAIIEVGAAAGLCLLLDLYGYDYGRLRLNAPSTRDIALILPCAVNAATPLPTRLPTIGWRMGLDLNPLSVTSAQDMDWLAALVWPEQEGRLARLRAAAAIARNSPPPVARGDALRDLPSIIACVPSGMTVVVFHSAVLAYVRSQRDRDAFAGLMMASEATWISNEAPGVFPAIAARAPRTDRQDRFLLAINGKPMAWTGPHGQSIDWFYS